MPPPPLPPDPYGDYYGTSPVLSGSRQSLIAAISTWISGVLLLLLSTCCVSSLVYVSTFSVDQLQQIFATEDLPEDYWENYSSFKSSLPVIIGLVAILTVIPSILLLILGFGVKKNNRLATVCSLIITSLALLIFGLFSVAGFFSVLATGQRDWSPILVMLLLCVILLWSVTALIKSLTQANRMTSSHQYAHVATENMNRSPDDDPWENSL